MNLSIQRIFSKIVFDSFFLSHHVILNAALLRTHLLRRMIQDLIYFFQKLFLISFFFLFLLCFYFFHKNYYHFTKGKEPAQSPKPDSFKFELFTVDISSRMTPARLYRSRLDAAVQSSVALLRAIRCS